MFTVMTLTTLATFTGEAATLTLYPQRVIHRIDEKVYGHFLEHIFHSVNGGLWGEMVWNRSFEELLGGGLWRVEGNELVQESLEENVRLTFGDPDWSDYEFTLEAQKVGGQEGFLILFRVRSVNDFYWLNLGGWGNRSHALERGRTGQGRWRVISPHVPGHIETGRWYHIRVRCEGPHFQAWLDGEKVLDFIDSERPHLAGQVGVGTWRTQARFRNLRVRSLEGEGLWEELPKVTLYRVARHWEAYGPGTVSLSTENPLNSRRCQFILAQGGETGLRQTPLCLRAGETYRGSLWARGEAPKGLVVRVKEGERVLLEQALPAPEAQWREFSFTFTPSVSAEHATLEIGAREPGQVWLDQVSLMAEGDRRAGGFRSDLLQAVAQLRPPIIRWPGGCFASAYRWKDGIGPQHRRRAYPRPLWDDLDVNSFGTDEFLALCRKVGAEPILVVNIGTRPWNGDVEEKEFLQDVLDWIEYCNGPADSPWGRVRAANGHPEPYGVRFWEIDNETWHMGAEAYAEAVHRFVPAMKKVDPTIKIIVCGSGGMGEKALEWNRILIERCADLMDYLSIHHYENPDRFAEGPRNYERFFRETARLIAASRNPHIKLFVSEWNAQSTDWRTGLYAGGLLNAFERCGEVVEMASPALFLRHVSATAWDNAFINFDHRTWFPAPNYVVMKVWRDHYAPLLVALEGEAGPLNAVATRSEDGRRLFLKMVNPSRQTVEVSLNIASRGTVQEASLLLVNPGDLAARNTLEEPHRIHPEAAPLHREGSRLRFTLPPLSAGVLRIGLE